MGTRAQLHAGGQTKPLVVLTLAANSRTMLSGGDSPLARISESTHQSVAGVARIVCARSSLW
jgi:hypothetical protein